MTVRSAERAVVAFAGIFIVVTVLFHDYEFLDPMQKWLVLPVIAASLYRWWLKRRQK